jgi:hypothetical protein
MCCLTDDTPRDGDDRRCGGRIPKGSSGTIVRSRALNMLYALLYEYSMLYAAFISICILRNSYCTVAALTQSTYLIY